MKIYREFLRIPNFPIYQSTARQYVGTSRVPSTKPCQSAHVHAQFGSDQCGVKMHLILTFRHSTVSRLHLRHLDAVTSTIRPFLAPSMSVASKKTQGTKQYVQGMSGNKQSQGEGERASKNDYIELPVANNHRLVFPPLVIPEPTFPT